jgi:hypothetical protein
MTDQSGAGSPAGEPAPEPFFDDVDPFAPPPPVDRAAPPAWGAGPAQQPAGAPWGTPGASPYPAPGNTDGFAIAALMCAIAGLFTAGVGGLLGIGLGVVALRRLRRSGDGGRWLAIAGILLGAATVVLGGIGLAAELGAITLPGVTTGTV